MSEEKRDISWKGVKVTIGGNEVPGVVAINYEVVEDTFEDIQLRFPTPNGQPFNVNVRMSLEEVERLKKCLPETKLQDITLRDTLQFLYLNGIQLTYGANSERPVGYSNTGPFEIIEKDNFVQFINSVSYEAWTEAIKDL